MLDDRNNHLRQMLDDRPNHLPLHESPWFEKARLGAMLEDANAFRSDLTYESLATTIHHGPIREEEEEHCDTATAAPLPMFRPTRLAHQFAGLFHDVTNRYRYLTGARAKQLTFLRNVQVSQTQVTSSKHRPKFYDV